jgi:hypothetical protein
MTVITITVRPLGRGRFSAHLNERLLVEGSRIPLFCAARVLQSEGLPADTILVMKHAGSDTIALRGRLSILAGLTVHEGDRNGLRITKYRTIYEDMPLPSVRCEQGQANATRPVLA